MKLIQKKQKLMKNKVSSKKPFKKKYQKKMKIKQENSNNHEEQENRNKHDKEDEDTYLSDQSDDFKVEEVLEKEIDSEEDSEDQQNEEEENEEEVSSSEDENDEEDELEKHRKSLQKLKETDPEFYKFLEENDKKLLHFNLSDEELSDAKVDDDDDDEEEKYHKPSENLEVASDDSDYEPDGDGDEVQDKKIITLKMLKSWQSEIHTDKSNKTIAILIQAFHAALRTISTEDDDTPSQFKVEGSAIFNGVVQICVLELGPAIRRFLGLSPGSKQPPHKCKKFIKIKHLLKSYFTDLLKLLTGVSSSNIQTVLLKHLHYMSTMLVSFPHISKPIVKRLITIWGTAEDGVRVIAFFCILRITNSQQASLLDTVLKAMYLTYVKNSKFVSVNTLAPINFMRRSLVEMFALDTNVSYQHVFLYIRQLAIHLRNAITVKKKENIQAVYNWQFVNSLKLWCNLLSLTCNKPQMQQLIYPFVQVCLGTLKLVPTAQYFPLRFHIVEMLIEFSRETGVFIPILPFIVEVLSIYDFNKKHQKVSMKPLNFMCLLRLSKSQLSENGFKDATIDSVYGLLLEYLSSVSHTIGFPDLSLFCVIQLKQFLKKCSNANYNRKMKQILEKIEQNNQFVENERKKLNIKITDFKQIEGFESQLKTKGTPMTTFFESWNKIHTIKKNKELTNNEALATKLPTIKKINKKVGKEDDGPVELFPSDSEDDETMLEKGGRKRGKRGGKNVNKKMKIDTVVEPIEENDTKDIIEDFKISDW